MVPQLLQAEAALLVRYDSAPVYSAEDDDDEDDDDGNDDGDDDDDDDDGVEEDDVVVNMRRTRTCVRCCEAATQFR
jgi:hypothetical protein